MEGGVAKADLDLADRRRQDQVGGDGVGVEGEVIEGKRGSAGAAPVYVEEERRRSGSQKTFEWFQWLAAQLERYSPGKTNLQIGAHAAYRDWKP